MEYETIASRETKPTEANLGAVTEQVSRLQHQIEQLDIHVDDLRGRLGSALSPDEPSDAAVISGALAQPRRQPSELAAQIEGCADRIERLRWVVSSIQDRVDL